MTLEATFTLLREIREKYEINPDQLYDHAVELLQYAAVQKNIEFDGYFRTKWEIEEDHPMTFGEEYFENENRSELYVYLAADANKEIYKCLEYAYNLTHKIKLSKKVLYQEIQSLKDRGITF
jgi:hypothetical protein